MIHRGGTGGEVCAVAVLCCARQTCTRVIGYSARVEVKRQYEEINGLKALRRARGREGASSERREDFVVGYVEPNGDTEGRMNLSREKAFYSFIM